MQNRYVGDIGDYVKLAILRRLSCGRRPGVAWWLFPDEHHNADGGHREYLGRQKEWERFDSDLFEALLEIEKQKKWNVRALEEAAILPNAVFTSDPIPCEVRPFSKRPIERLTWLERVRTKLKDCDLVFLDPNNGIASDRLKLTCRRAGKSVTIEEIKALQEDAHRTMVIYHHQTRAPGGHGLEISNLATRLKDNGLHVSGVLRAKPWAPRVFFILNGDKELLNRAKDIAAHWEDRIAWYSDVEILRGSLATDQHEALRTANTTDWNRIRASHEPLGTRALTRL